MWTLFISSLRLCYAAQIWSLLMRFISHHSHPSSFCLPSQAGSLGVNISWVA